jgi:hypothetical protein
MTIRKKSPYEAAGHRGAANPLVLGEPNCFTPAKQRR